MLGKAHLSIGMAAAFTAVMPESMPAALPVIAGAAAGSLICDIDCNSPSEKSDASKCRKSAVFIVAAALIADKAYGGAMWQSAADRGAYIWCAGVAGLVLTLAFASVSSHRGFSHSLLALGLQAAFLHMIFPQTVLPFTVAFITHIVLDMTNKKNVRLLYPAKRGFCLGWFYADRLADKVCTTAGTIWLAAVILICMKR